ncbi:MAG: PEP-CTERM sorting domain-containing protein, partial [Thermoguttaceae bacterium]|nr:PEP-CTERM sorting domain-containing protein [Thermoguttaceae bacterium]
ENSFPDNYYDAADRIEAILEMDKMAHIAGTYRLDGEGFGGDFDITLNADGTVTKGIGTITITDLGTLTVEDGSILNFDVASKTSYDQIVFAAATTLDLAGATVNLNFTEDFDPTNIGLEDTLTLFGTNTTLKTDGASLRYNVSQLPETAQWMRFMLTPQGVQVVDGNYVPEPAAWVLLLLGAGMIGGFARSRKGRK